MKKEITKPIKDNTDTTIKAMFAPYISGCVISGRSAAVSAVVVMTVTKIAVPTDAAIIFIVLSIAAPCGINRFGSRLSPAVATGIITIARPNIRMPYITVKKVKDVAGLKVANANDDPVMIVNPMIASHRAPNLSNSLPVIGDKSPVMSAPGKSARPASNAVKSLMFCMNSGMIVSAPINPKNVIIPMMIVSGKMEFANTLNSSIGCAKRSCLVMNKTRATTPIASQSRVLGAVHPRLPAHVNPYSNPPKPNDDRMIEVTSTFVLDVSVTFFNAKKATIISMMAIGRMMKKRMRHE